MSWRRVNPAAIGANPPPYRPNVKSVAAPGLRYTVFRTRFRYFDATIGGWQAWDSWTDFDYWYPDCWFLGASAAKASGSPGVDYREEYQMEVALMGSPWAITWINTLTPIGGGAPSTVENYLLILPGATYTANFTATADTTLESITPADYQLHYPAP
jgi:hypothetical protein